MLVLDKYIKLDKIGLIQQHPKIVKFNETDIKLIILKLFVKSVFVV